MTRPDPLFTAAEHAVECPHCGSIDVHRSRRSWLEHLLNGILWYHQRPFYCSTCKSRFWVRLESHVWRRAIRFDIRRIIMRLKWYGIAVFIAFLLACALIIYDMGMVSFEEKALEVWHNTDLTPGTKGE